MVVRSRLVLQLFPLIVIAGLVIFEDRVSIPSCELVPAGDQLVREDHPDDLKVMIVANLLLLGSEAGYWNFYFRDYYLSKFFAKSFETLKPDMLLVLGDVSAKGSKLTRSKWSSVLSQFHGLLGPFLGLPFHVILGDRDIGDCSRLNPISIDRIASNFPGLDSAGCGAFEISNISFVSLNAVSLLCGNNDLRFSVEKVIERESIDLLRMDSEHRTEMLDGTTPLRLSSGDFGWRDNAASSGSGPVLLLHFPLPLAESNKFRCGRAVGRISNHGHKSSKMLESRGLVGTGPYELLHTLPRNATEYIFQALKPRIIFSAHTHAFCDCIHPDGTREITVPAMTWDARNDPGFVVAMFRRNGSVTVSHCSLAKESNVVIAYISILVLFISTILLGKSSHVISSGSHN